VFFNARVITKQYILRKNHFGVNTGAAEKRAIVTIIQTLYLQNYKNIILTYTTKLITFWTWHLQGDLHRWANTPLVLSRSNNARSCAAHCIYKLCDTTEYIRYENLLGEEQAKCNTDDDIYTYDSEKDEQESRRG